jgi:hypothetical protein
MTGIQTPLEEGKTSRSSRTMNDDGWLADTRTSYDTVAASYTARVPDVLVADPYLRAALALFADLVRAAGGGPVADPDTSQPTYTPSASTLSASTSHPR